MNFQFAKLAIVTVLSVVCISTNDIQADETVDINKISPEVMKSYQSRNRAMVVTWLAPQYIEAMGISSGAPKYEVKSVTRELKNYTIFCVMSKSFDFYNPKSVSPDEIQKKIRLVDKNGKVYQPLKPNEIATMAKIYGNALKSGFERGAGQPIAIVMFPAKDSNGNSIADAAKKGSFKIELESLKVKWDLPLQSLK